MTAEEKNEISKEVKKFSDKDVDKKTMDILFEVEERNEFYMVL